MCYEVVPLLFQAVKKYKQAEVKQVLLKDEEEKNKEKQQQQQQNHHILGDFSS